MIAPPEEIEALEAFFVSNTLPERIQLNDATTLTNLKAFVRQVLDNLKGSGISETSLRPRYEDLLQIRKLLES
jgi:hypothetical protein